MPELPKLGESKWDVLSDPENAVNLRLLQKRARAGESVNLVDEFAHLVPDDRVVELAAIHYPGQRRSTGIDNMVRGNIAGRFVVDGLDGFFESADSVSAFVWRTTAIVNAAGKGIKYYKGRDLTGEETTAKLLDLVLPIGRALLEFCEREPQSTDRVLPSWWTAIMQGIPYNRRGTAGRYDYISEPLEKAALNRGKKPGFAEEQRQKDSAIVRVVGSRMTWLDGPTSASRRDLRILPDLELVDVTHNNPQNLAFLADQLAADKVYRGSPNRLNAASVTATLNFCRSLADLIGISVPSRARDMYNILRKLSVSDSEIISYESVIHAVNTDVNQRIINAAVAKNPRFDTSQITDLKEGKLSDFPVAIARIISFAASEPKAKRVVKKTEQDIPTAGDSFRLAAHCIGLMATKGTNLKLAQLGKYDRAAVFQGLTREEVAAIIQRSRAGESVHGIHRRINQDYRGKKGYGYGVKEPGHGLLS